MKTNKRITVKAMQTLIVTLRSDCDPCAFARFTWSADLLDCDLVALGLTDEELDAIMLAKGHEGADVDGFTVELV